jgi:hypothetical protein
VDADDITDVDHVRQWFRSIICKELDRETRHYTLAFACLLSGLLVQGLVY